MDFGEQTLLGIRLGVIATIASILALVGIADVLLRWVVRRKIRRDEAAVADASRHELVQWLDRGLKQAVPPLTLLMWVLGGYAVLSTALADLGSVAAAAPAGCAAIWARDAGTMVALFWLLLRIGRVIEAATAALASRTVNAWDDAALPIAGHAAWLLLPTLALILGVQVLSIPAELRNLVRTGLILVLIGITPILLYRCVQAAEKLILQRYRIDVSDNLRARAVYTQVTVLRKIAAAIIGIFTLASMLMVFDSVRQLGTSILASACIAGIIIGLAAQGSISALLAWLQIAVMQPVRLDDVVIVENDWGGIEEITLTYVIVQPSCAPPRPSCRSPCRHRRGGLTR